MIQDPLAPIKHKKRKKKKESELVTGLENLSHSEQITANAVAHKEKLLDEDTQVDISIEMKKTLLKDINDAVAQGCSQFPNKDFFLEVFYLKYDSLQNELHIKNKIIVTPLCPTPTHNHSVFHYHTDSGLEHLWTIPTLERGLEMIKNPMSVPKEEEPLFRHLVDFMDYTLRNKAKKLNGEI